MHNTRLMIVASLMAAAAAGEALAGRPGEPKSFSLGLALGAPTGITAKYWLNATNALSGVVGGLGYRGVVVQGDYVWHRHDVVRSAAPRTTAHWSAPPPPRARSRRRPASSSTPSGRGWSPARSSSHRPPTPAGPRCSSPRARW